MKLIHLRPCNHQLCYPHFSSKQIILCKKQNAILIPLKNVFIELCKTLHMYKLIIVLDPISIENSIKKEV